MTTKTIFGLTSVLTFGKHKGETIAQVIEDNSSYLEWAIDNIAWFELSQEAEDALENALDDISMEDEPSYRQDWH